MEIRKATLEDLPAIQQLNYQLCLIEAENYDPTVIADWPLSKAGARYFSDRIKNAFAVVAEEDGQIIGYSVGGLDQAETYRNVGVLGIVENTYVQPQHRRKGIGTKLFEEFLKWCKKKGVTRIRRIASAENKDAIKLYRRQGFSDYEVVLEKDI
ncbi:GNAT family N-acetyltransferase [Candidatus Woesearchaeota archaeon]|nr:GNAT family N-acetyltransferase [Candidatus Woesearchaeota archaeon]